MHLRTHPHASHMPLGRECRAQAKLGRAGDQWNGRRRRYNKNRCVRSEAQGEALASKVAKAKAGVWSYSSERGD